MRTDYRSPAPVALTFDDGPDPIWTPLVLDALANVGASATFFVVTPRAARYASLMSSMRERPRRRLSLRRARPPRRHDAEGDRSRRRVRTPGARAARAVLENAVGPHHTGDRRGGNQTPAPARRRQRQIVITDEGEELSYDVCVLATGSEPIRPPVPGGDDPEILTMRTVENSTRLQDRVGEGDRAVVVGSAFIGCEAAASLSMRGAEVTLASHEQSPQRRRLGDAVGNASKVGYGTSALTFASGSRSKASNARMAASL
jgi:hypothetical protein